MTRLFLVLLLFLSPLLQAQDDAVSLVAKRLGDTLAGKAGSLALGVVIQENTSRENIRYLKKLLEKRISEDNRLSIKTFAFPRELELISDPQRYRQILASEKIDYFVHAIFSRNGKDYYVTCQIVAREKRNDDLLVINLGFAPELAMLFKNKISETETNNSKTPLIARFPVSKDSLAISGFSASTTSPDILVLLTPAQIYLFGSRSGTPALQKTHALPQIESSEYITRAPVAQLSRIYDDEGNSSLAATSNLWAQSIILSGSDLSGQVQPHYLLAPYTRDNKQLWLTGFYLPGENSWGESIRIVDDRGTSFKLYSFENLKELVRISSEGNSYIVRNVYDEISIWQEDESLENLERTNQQVEKIKNIKALTYDTKLTGMIVIAATSDPSLLHLETGDNQEGDYLVFLDRKGKKLNPLKACIPTSLDIKDIAVYNPAITSGKAIAVLGADKNKELFLEIYSWPENLFEDTRINGN